MSVKTIDHQSQHEGYVGIVEYTDSLQIQTHGDITDVVVSSSTEDESGYTRLQRELPGYEKLRHPALKSDVDEPENTSLQSLSRGYVAVPEYLNPNPVKKCRVSSRIHSNRR